MEIRVNQSDIDSGTKGNIFDCAVAKALCRYNPAHAEFIFVGVNCIWIGNNKYKTPDPVIKAISDFDNGKKLEPFAFELGEPTNA